MARTRAKARRAAHLAAVATGPLGALSHDEVGVVFEALAEPLEPHVAVALASTCLGLRVPTAAALAELRRRHEAVKALLAKDAAPSWYDATYRGLAERGMRHRVYRGFAWRLCDCELGCNAVLRTPKQAQSHVAAHK